jgi:hypothetical protein
VVVPVTIPAVIPWARHEPAVGDRPSLDRSPLPLPLLPAGRPSSAVYAVASIDCNGRVAERMVIRALGWHVDLALDVRILSDLIVVRPDLRGPLRLFAPGCVRLPAEIRHRCALVPGARLLLAGDPDQGQLVIYPPADLDRMVSTFSTAALEPEVAA